MQNSLTLGRKVVATMLAVATVLWTLGFAAFAVPSTASAVETGSVVKGSLPALYYLAGDGQRYTFPNLATYETWFSNFSGVQTVSDSVLASYPLAGNVTYRPGSRLLKIQSDPKTYAVGLNGTLRWVETEAVAVGLAGSAWNTLIDDISEVFFVDYTVGTSLMSAAAYDGMLLTDGTNNYAVQNGMKRMVTSAGMSANNLQARFFVTPGDDLLSALSAGSDLVAAEGGMKDPAQLGDTVVTAPVGGLTVSLASDTPASATVPSSASNVALMKFNLTANSGAANVSQLALKLLGLGAVSNLTAVYLYEGADRLTSSRTFNGTTRVATFGGLNLAVASGQTRVITVVGETDGTDGSPMTGGDTMQIAIESMSSIQSDATVSGSFPVSGNQMTTSATDVGTATLTKVGTVSSPTLGQANAKIAEVQIAAGSDEGILVQSVRLDIRDASKHSNFVLEQNNVEVASGVQSGDFVMFTFASPFVIAQGNNRNFVVKATVGGDANDTIKTRMEETTDLVAIGDKYGYGVGVTNSFSTTPGSCLTTATAGCHFASIQGGQLTFADNSASSHDIGLDSDAVELFRMTLTAENYAELRDIDFTINGSNLIGAGTDYNFQNFRLVNADTGATLMGPVDFTATGLIDTTGQLDFTDDFTMQAGDVLDIQLLGDVKSGTAPYTNATGETITAVLFVSGISARDANNDDLAAGTDIIPASNLTGNALTVRTASLTVNRASTPVSGSYVKGTSNIDFVGFTFKAGTASDATMSDITFAGGGAEDGTLAGPEYDLNVQSNITSCSIYDGLTGSLIKGPESFGSFTAGALTDLAFSSFNWTIPAGQTYKMNVRCNIANYTVAGADDQYGIQIKGGSAANITTVDEDGNAIGETMTTFNVLTTSPVAVTVANAGTLTAALSGSTPNSAIVLGDSTGVAVSEFKFTSTSEAFLVDRLTVDNTSGTDTAVSSVELHYNDQAGAAQVASGFLASGTFTFEGLTFYVPSNGSANVTVVVNTGEVSSNNLAAGSVVGLDLSNGTDEIRAIGLGSNTTLVAGSVAGFISNIVEANNMTIQKTKPTISLASGSPAGTGTTTGLDEVLRFTVTADIRGEVTWSQNVFQLNSTDNSATLWNTCGGDAGALNDGMAVADFRFYDASDITTDLAASAAAGDRLVLLDSAGEACAGADVLTYVVLDLDLVASAVEEVAAGTTKTYYLEFNATGASPVTDDQIRFDIPSETEVDALSGTWGAGVGSPQTAFEWDDSNTGDTGNDATNIKNLPVSGGSLTF